MTVMITIGNIEVNPDGDFEGQLHVPEVELDEAPFFANDLSGRSNRRNSGTGSFHNWMAFVDFGRDIAEQSIRNRYLDEKLMTGRLYRFFFARGSGLIHESPCGPPPEYKRTSPDVRGLTVDHLHKLLDIIDNYMERPWSGSERIIGWDPYNPMSNDFDNSKKWEPDQRYDPGLARLLWCKWWIEWALRQERPGIDWSW